MKTERRDKIIDVFNSVLELPNEDQNAYIQENLSDDKTAIDEVRELLKSHAEANDFMEESPAKFANENLTKENGSKHLTQIGVYKIEDEIGSGGMGRVYLASRADKQFDQKVAIKVLKRGMDTEKIVERFKYERQILADLNHPNIAKLLDGGTTKDGLPFFVLEYIEGVPITEFCHKNNINLEKRLTLFRQVCDAVSYAHQNLVVHRDIKPNNILVTEEGTPKLLDFGIAKVLETNSDKQTLTIADERLMTPKYASPEQIQGNQITTATDIYSLGVLFYEILTGNLPYKFTSKSPHEVGQIICEQVPTLPSQVQSSEFSVKGYSSAKPTLDNENAETKDSTENTKNNSEHGTLSSKLLKGDLDNIALMTLEKEPDKRYGSVDEFSSDVKRYLDGMPVIARKHTLFYRGAKFVKRHKIGVVFAGVVATLLIGFAVNSQVQANRIAKERDRSEKVLAFMSEIFEGNDPANAKGKEVSARELLDQGVEKINELDDQPDVQATLMNSVGRVYFSLGEFDKAQKLFEQSLQKRRDYFGKESAEVAETLNYLANLQRDTAEFDAADKNIRKSLEIRLKLFGESSEEVYETLGLLVLNYTYKKDWKKAEEAALDQIEVGNSVFGEKSKENVADVIGLADIQMRGGKTDESEKLVREIIQLSKEVFDKPTQESVKANVLLARILFYHRDEFIESKKLLDEAEEMAEEVYGKIHPEIDWVYTNQAIYYVEKGEYKESAKVSDKLIGMYRQLYGDNEHPKIGYAMTVKAAHLFQGEYYDEAEEIWGESLKIQIKTQGEEHPVTTQILSNLALSKYEQGKYATAAEDFRKSLEIQRKIMDKGNPQIGFSLIGLGKSIVADKKAKEAEPLIRDGVKILEDSFFKKTWYFAEARNMLGACLLEQGKYDEAETLLTDSYEKLDKQFGKDHKKTKRAKEYLAKLYNAVGQENKAKEYQ